MTEILYNLPEVEYHKRPELSASRLKDFITSPLNYWYHHINPDRPIRESTAAFEVGSAVHKLVLEGIDAFNNAYAEPVPKGLKKPTAAQINAAKPSEKTVEQLREWNDWEDTQKGKIILSDADRATVMRCYEAVKQHPEASAALKAATATEVSVIFDLDGVPMRSRFDALTPIGVIDLKTTVDAAARPVMYSISNYRYDVQAYIYCKAFEAAFGKLPEHFTFIFVEKTAPYHVGVYRLDEHWMAYAADLVSSKLSHYKYCLETGQWPGVNDDELKVLSKPTTKGDL